MLEQALLVLNIFTSAGEGAWIQITPIVASAEEFDRHYLEGENPNESEDPIQEAYDSTLDLNAKLRLQSSGELGNCLDHRIDSYYDKFDYSRAIYRCTCVYYFMDDRAYITRIPWVPANQFKDEENPSFYLDKACAHINACTVAMRTRDVKSAQKHHDEARVECNKIVARITDYNREMYEPVVQTFSRKLESLQSKVKWLETHSTNLSDNSGSPAAK